MTNDAMTYSVRAALVVLLLAVGCSKTNDTASSSGSHWLQCEGDADCAGQGDDSRCGNDGFCVDVSGRRIVLTPPEGGTTGEAGDGGGSGATGGTGASGAGGGGDASGGSNASGGSGGTGTSGTGGGGGSTSGGSGGGYEPCGGKSCGDSCRLCDPNDKDCVETDEIKICDDSGTCTGSPAVCSGVVLPDCGGAVGGSEGGSCMGRDDQPIPECCTNSTHLRCSFNVCTASIPAQCSGTWRAVTGSDACGGYDPCAGKSCGDTCMLCEPGDSTCVEDLVLKECDMGGNCVAAAADCAPPESCDPFGATDTCGQGMVCCAIGRCGPVVTDQGICEQADPKTGDCMACACESQPGGCPICNSPDTPIATPDGERAIAELREGDLVYSMNRGELVAVPVLATRQVRVHDHAVVRLTLDNGQVIEVSGSHPTAQGVRLDALAPGDAVGEVRVLSAELIPYQHDRTYDILPASDSGSYLAGGALLQSTLAGIVVDSALAARSR